MTKDHLIAYCRKWKIVYPADIAKQFGLSESDSFDVLQHLVEDGYLRRARTEEIGFALK